MNRADYNVGNLESKVELQINEAVKSIETLVSSLSSLKTALNGTINSTDTNKLKNNVDSSIDKVDVLKKALNFGGIVYGIKKGLSVVKDVASANIDMIETANLFEVQLGKVTDEYGNLNEAQSTYYTKAMAFQDEMNEMLGTNKAELEKYQAMYFGMLNSQLGAKNKDVSYMMSESLTKAGYDIASLYNLDVETAMNKLKSGLAGQIESLRQIGIDVSEASLSRVLDQVGIERSVQQLSYAEKEVARYIAICQQAGVAQGDFARTFEQPANQVRVFKNQLIELKQVIGAFIMSAFGQILPIVNGIIMAIKEVLKALASLFGFNLNLGSSGGSTLSSGIGSVADSAGTAGKNLGKATKQAKEFKKQLMGFDEINNIEPPTESTSGGGGSSGGGGGIGGSVDPALLNALKEWDNMMDKISGKAQEIRDKILDWLGVTDGTFANLKRIWEVVQSIGAGFLGWKISKGILDFLQNLGLLKNVNAFQMAFGIGLTISGIWAQYKGTKRLLNGDINLFSILETVLGTAGGTFGIANILRSINKGKMFTWGESLKIGFGVMLAIQGVQVLLDGVKKGNIKKTLLGALELTGSLAVTLKTLAGNNAIQNLITKFKEFGTGVKAGCSTAKTWISLIVEQYKIFRNNGNGVIQSLKLTAGQMTETSGSMLAFAGKIPRINCRYSWNSRWLLACI